ncbi:uncharacterized protein A4U43_C07F37090 [Asparagus officinalis]|uniref:Uncharacterized protein n=1 Tax=Asparagus officinalis TaxID=4686 RepID=A0A5P1EHM6_ASPOF|nr:uncharacterized protein A4U43_C07F37090 [Asparagus officinalis]
MDRGEPTLAPEWLKATNSSSHSDENSSGAFSRNRINRLAVSVSEHDAPRASSSSTSFRRIANTNGSMGQEKDSYAHSRAYSSFGRSRDRDRDRDRDRHRDRQKDSLLGNGYCDYADSLMTRRSETKRTEIDSLRRSKSVVSGRKFESMSRRSGSDSISALSAGSLSGSLSKVSFDRDFPSLGAEEKHELVRVPSPGISSAINSLHISSPTIIGADRWTSALAEAPAVGISNGLQTAASMTSTGSNTTGGLSMAETLAQAPSKARSAPLLSNENERRKELTLMQYNKLIPVTSSRYMTYSVHTISFENSMHDFHVLG